MSAFSPTRFRWGWSRPPGITRRGSFIHPAGDGFEEWLNRHGPDENKVYL